MRQADAINVVASGLSYKIDFEKSGMSFNFLISRHTSGMIVFTGGLVYATGKSTPLFDGEMKPCVISFTTMNGFEYVLCGFERNQEIDEMLFETFRTVLKHIREVYDGRWV
tara:strand:- start:348 stop:680 length:333 start_codon:yes stop_codon:yes gene_type:complete